MNYFRLDAPQSLKRVPTSTFYEFNNQPSRNHGSASTVISKFGVCEYTVSVNEFLTYRMPGLYLDI